uniref:Putative collagen-like secreted protein n=1 Tax=Amblyomma triste TaxID=251400 RepID=A0A023G5Y0_AMBTT
MAAQVLFRIHLLIILLVLTSILEANQQYCSNKVCVLNDGDESCGQYCSCQKDPEKPENTKEGVCAFAWEKFWNFQTGQVAQASSTQGTVQSPDVSSTLGIPQEGVAQATLQGIYGNGVHGTAQSPYGGGVLNNGGISPGTPQGTYGGSVRGQAQGPYVGGPPNYGMVTSGAADSLYGAHMTGMPQGSYGTMQGMYPSVYGNPYGQIGPSVMAGIQSATYGIGNILQQHYMRKQIANAMQSQYQDSQAQLESPGPSSPKSIPETPPPVPPRSSSLFSASKPLPPFHQEYTSYPYL